MEKTWSFGEVKARVSKVVSPEIVNEVVGRVRKSKSTLWGKEEPRDFAVKVVWVALFKDIKAVGYARLRNLVNNWLPMNSKSFRHNQKVVRRAAADWAKAALKRGKSKDRWEASKIVQFLKPIKGISAWLDSVEFPLIGKNRVKFL